jgi:hypothetical protein
VRYFVTFARDEREMPVIWHQNLLTFVQRYKNDLTAKHKAALHHVIQKQKHRLMVYISRRRFCVLCVCSADFFFDRWCAVT